LGQYHPSCANPGGPPCEPIIQVLNGAIGNPPGGMVVYGSPAYFNNTVFYKAEQDFVKAFPLVNGQLAAPVAQSASNISESATPSISYDSTTQTPAAIVWTVESEPSPVGGLPAFAMLHAYSANSLQELYRDIVGPRMKFNPPPTIAAGKVFVGTQSQLLVYGGGLSFPLQTGTLTVTLQVVPASSRGTFDVLVDGARQLWGMANGATTVPLSLASGAHLVSATPSPGTSGSYGFSFTGTCQAGGLVTLQPGNQATCTIVAQALITQLTVNLILVHPDANQLRLFNVNVDGVTVAASSNGGTITLPVNPGLHTVSQTGGTGTNLVQFFSVIGGDCAANGTVNVAQGQSKTCTITNYDNVGGCKLHNLCCEEGTETQGCLKCVDPGKQKGCP